MKRQHLTLLGVAALVFHLAALLKDVDQVLFNLRRVRDDPSLANLARLLAAEGVLVADLGI